MSSTRTIEGWAHKDGKEAASSVARDIEAGNCAEYNSVRDAHDCGEVASVSASQRVLRSSKEWETYCHTFELAFGTRAQSLFERRQDGLSRMKFASSKP